ncbi:MAG: hypothetical protein ACI9HE_002171 [Planctomycetota bacterium]|jgi:hypothetical protein
MSLITRFGGFTLAALSVLASGCSSSSDAAPTAALLSVVQDLGIDATGATTVLSFDRNPGTITGAKVRITGTQAVVSATQNGTSVTVVWDERVTTAFSVRILESIDSTGNSVQVTTSDSTPPTFAVNSATQDTGDALLGGDQIVIGFSGVNIVEAAAEDDANWTLATNGNNLDLSDSTLTFNAGAQTLTMDLGVSANIHASFTLTPGAGVIGVSEVSLGGGSLVAAATGDNTAPTLTSSEQRIAISASGDVVDFIFNEPMDPLASNAGNFTVNDHGGAPAQTIVFGVTQVDAVTLRVIYSAPVVPGLDTLDHTGLVDAHGNAIAGATVAIGNGEASANAYTGVVATTVAGVSGDSITVTTSGALDPDFATDPTLWSIDVDGGALTMADHVLTYDLATRTLTVALQGLDMRNGDAVDVTGTGLTDVDGDNFTAAATSVNAGGDAGAPSLLTITQNRDADGSGKTVDVAFDEDLHGTEAQTTTNYTFAPVVVIDSATLQPDGSTVRLVVQDVIVPGDYTLNVSANVDDLAGNTMGAPSGATAIVSTDVTDPGIQLAQAAAIEGADNDTIVVLFNDDMIEAEVETLANWSLESPVGTTITLAAEAVSYDADSRVVTLTLDAGDQYLVGADDFQVSMSTMRDLAGNSIDMTAANGTVSAESNRPSVSLAYVDPGDNTKLEVRFSEPCGPFDDLYHPTNNATGTHFFLLKTNVGVIKGHPLSSTSTHGGLGVTIDYGFVITAGDTVDVIGLTDLAGNLMFPADGEVIATRNTTLPSIAGGPAVTAVSGEMNDTIVITFAVDMSPWRLLSASNYNVVTNPGGLVVDLTGASLEQTDTDEVTMTLAAGANRDLQGATNYDVSLLLLGDPLRSAHGEALAAQDDQTVAVAGDITTGPSQGGSLAVVDVNTANTLVIVFDEAVDATASTVPANYDYDGGNIATAVSLIGPRSVRVTFGVAVSAGNSVDITQTSAVDLAGNDSGGTITLAAVSDITAPSLAAVDGFSTESNGGDYVRVQFTEPVSSTDVVNVNNFVMTNGGAVSLVGAWFAYESGSATVSIYLPDGVDLDANQTVTVSVSNVADAAGTSMPSAIALAGSITGDASDPSFGIAFINYDEDPTGQVIDVQFSEDVNTTFPLILSSWSTDGTANVTGVEFFGADHIRVQLDASLMAGDQIELAAGLTDLAGNMAAMLQIVPLDGQE